MSDTGDHEVGYGKPPREHRFKKGLSGNSKGRPKGAKGLRKIFQEQAHAQVTVTEGGRSESVSKIEAVVMRLFANALHGSDRAVEQVQRLAGDFLPDIPDDDKQAPVSSRDQEMVARFVASVIARHPTESTDTGPVELSGDLS